jgi:tetratricopeptide (TPR) repeat protein
MTARRSARLALIALTAFISLGLLLHSLSPAQSQDGDDSPDLIGQGISDYWQGNYAQALIDFEGALGSQPENVEAIVYLAATYRALGDYTGAEFQLDRALELNPDSALAHAMRAQLKLENDEMPAAIFAAETALEIDPDLSLGHFQQARIFEAEDDLPAALEAYSQALALDDGDIPAYTANLRWQRGLAYEAAEDVEAALEDYNAIIESQPEFLDARFRRASLFSQLGDDQAAISDYSTAIALGYWPPQDAYLGRGLAYARLNQANRALADFAQAASLAPADDSARDYGAGLLDSAAVLGSSDFPAAELTPANGVLATGAIGTEANFTLTFGCRPTPIQALFYGESILQNPGGEELRQGVFYHRSAEEAEAAFQTIADSLASEPACTVGSEQLTLTPSSSEEVGDEAAAFDFALASFSTSRQGQALLFRQGNINSLILFSTTHEYVDVAGTLAELLVLAEAKVSRVAPPGGQPIAQASTPTPGPSPTSTSTATATLTPSPSPSPTATVTPSPTRTRPPSATPTRTATPTPSPSPTPEVGCTITASTTVNKRQGPGTNYPLAGQFSGGTSLRGIGQYRGGDNFIWWQLEDSTFVREDVVTAQADCLDLGEPIIPTPANRYVTPPDARLLSGGIGLTDGQPMPPGDFQIEYYCENRGYSPTHDDEDWFCVNSAGNQVFTFTIEDYDTICRETYETIFAFAVRDGTGEVPAFRWRCYEYE